MSWIVEAWSRCVLAGLGACFIVSELQPVVQSGVQQVMLLSSSDMSLMTWQWCGVVQGGEWGFVVQAGVVWVVWERFWTIIEVYWAGRVVLSSKFAHCHVTQSAGL